MMNVITRPDGRDFSALPYDARDYREGLDGGVRGVRIGVLEDVGFGLKPDSQVRDMLIAAAKAQDLVLAIPAPSVLFAEFSDWALKFNLICFVDDIELGERTRSDINFDILRRMREANLRIPYPALPPPKPAES